MIPTAMLRMRYGSGGMALSSLAVEDAADLLDARLDLARLSVIRPLVIAASAELVGDVLLRDDADLAVVRIPVALAVPEPLGAGIVRVAEGGRDATEAAGADVLDRLVDREVGGVGLRRRGEVRRGLGKRDAAFGHADELHGVGRRDREGKRLRVGQADVFGRRDDEATGDEPRVLPRLDHAGEVVHGGVDVGSADGLDEGADDVV